MMAAKAVSGFVKKFALGSALLACTFSPSNGAEEIGATRKVINLVSGSLPGLQRTLDRGDPVFQDERISAAANSSAQMVFKDGTRLAVGSSASVVLDRFVYTGAGGSGTLVLNAAQGAFRFVTGKMPSRNYKIVTPASTIGVRGTMFDVFVGAIGETIVVLLRGETDVCNRANQCRTLRNHCEAVRVEPTGQMTMGRGLSGQVLGGNAADSVAPFMYSQGSLVRSLQAPEHTIKTCLGASFGNPGGADREGFDAPNAPNRPEPSPRPELKDDINNGNFNDNF
ncbi:MAG: FecR family protein [Hyphomicrobiales bacterium]